MNAFYPYLYLVPKYYILNDEHVVREGDYILYPSTIRSRWLMVEKGDAASGLAASLHLIVRREIPHDVRVKIAQDIEKAIDNETPYADAFGQYLLEQADD